MKRNSIVLLGVAALLGACNSTPITPSDVLNPAPTPTPAATSGGAQDTLALVNAARASGKTCGGTFYPAVPALTWNAKLEAAALAHSNDMKAQNYFSHTGKDGSSAGTRITRQGYTWNTWGENIAWGYRDSAAVMKGWLESSGHCKNIMGKNFTEIGVARDGGTGTIWTMVLARPR
jgi:uncharacterized protein YkwD